MTLAFNRGLKGVISISESIGRTKGLKPERAKLLTGVNCIISKVGLTIEPPALRLYAVEPVDVEIITPSK